VRPAPWHDAPLPGNRRSREPLDLPFRAWRCTAPTADASSREGSG
jgi:hypothetical protein